MTRSLLLAAVLVASSVGTTLAQQPASGMLLGIYAFPNFHGLRVTSTIPGYSADGRLFPNDVITRATDDGVNVHRIRRLWDLERAKDQIGPNRWAALEILRPGQGYIYMWVQFVPVGVGPAAVAQGANTQGASTQNVQARILTPQERGGAQNLFGGRNSQTSPPNAGTNPPPSAGNPPVNNPSPPNFGNPPRNNPSPPSFGPPRHGSPPRPNPIPTPNPPRRGGPAPGFGGLFGR